MITDDERREVARRLREMPNSATWTADRFGEALLQLLVYGNGRESFNRLADLIDPSYKPDAKYEAWYSSLSHYGDERGGPSTIRDLIEEIVWTALTVDLGPNGNTDPSTGIDEGGVYTDKLFAEWEREALRLSGGIDRDALLALADEYETNAEKARRLQDEAKGIFKDRLRVMHFAYEMAFSNAASRIREALGVQDA